MAILIIITVTQAAAAAATQRAPAVVGRCHLPTVAAQWRPVTADVIERSQ